EGLSREALGVMEKLRLLGSRGAPDEGGGAPRAAAPRPDERPAAAVDERLTTTVKSMFGQASWEFAQNSPAGKAAAEQAGAGAADAAAPQPSTEDPRRRPAAGQARAGLDVVPRRGGGGDAAQVPGRHPAEAPARWSRAHLRPDQARVRAEGQGQRRVGSRQRRRQGEAPDGARGARQIRGPLASRRPGPARFVPWYEGVLLLACLERE
ncbi:unnamed protein product, partial [Prorocentrum cordatum]